jgi:hypothetical protein
MSGVDGCGVTNFHEEAVEKGHGNTTVTSSMEKVVVVDLPVPRRLNNEDGCLLGC